VCFCFLLSSLGFLYSLLLFLIVKKFEITQDKGTPKSGRKLQEREKAKKRE
jgi:hypothetical protein